MSQIMMMVIILLMRMTIKNKEGKMINLTQVINKIKLVKLLKI